MCKNVPVNNILFKQLFVCMLLLCKMDYARRVPSHIIRLGGSHEFSCFIITVGKLWALAGIHDFVVDPATYAPNTGDQMVVWKQFNRGVRELTSAYEVLVTLLFDWKPFFNWCKDENSWNKLILKQMYGRRSLTVTFHFLKHPKALKVLNSSTSVFKEHMLPLFAEFRIHACKLSPTFVFLDIYLRVVGIL